MTKPTARQEAIQLVEAIRGLGRGPATATASGFKAVQRDGATQGTSPSLKQAALSRGLDVVCGCCAPLNSHNHTYYSLLDGIASPEDMVDMSAMRGFGGIGISDHGVMGGVLRAGKAAKAWKLGRLRDSGQVFTYKEVEGGKPLQKALSKLKLCDSLWQPLSDEAKQEAIKSRERAKRVILHHNPQAPSQCRIIEEMEFFRIARVKVTRQVVSYEEAACGPDLRSRLETAELCTLDWVGLESGARETALAAASEPDKRLLLAHSPDGSSKVAILGAKDFEAADDFRAISGCELYVSWAKDSGKRYNHITVYATGEKGHRALVLLTSIGSIPSRRFIGERGFFRPRVFVEDIEKAVVEAEGELIVTTGCPISITSEALRDGREDDARAFFEWGKRTLPEGRFLAELHLTTVGLDFNRLWAKAEDRFYSKVFQAPVSRFRHETRDEALAYAENFHRRLRLFVLGDGLRGFRVASDGSIRTAIQDSMIHESMRHLRVHTDGIVYQLAAAGINEDRYSIFQKDEIERAPDLAREVSIICDSLLAAGMEAAGGPGPMSPDAAGGASEPTKGKAKKKKARNLQLLDEDSLALLSQSLKVIGKHERGGLPDEDRPIVAAGALVARLAAFVIAEIGHFDDVEIVNPLSVVHAILQIPKARGIGDPGDADALASLAADRSLFLDLVSEGGMERDVIFAAARAVVALLKPERFDHLSLGELNPTAGEEDEVEREWIQHENWMERVNSGLVRLAREYDVPLLLATDSHMTFPEQKSKQDAMIKRGKRRNWHMARPYAIPRSDLVGMLDDLGAEWREPGMEYLPQEGNAVFGMIEKGIVSFDDIIEAVGGGSLLLDEVRSVGTFKWQTAVPKIKYENHPYFAEASELLKPIEEADGRLGDCILREFLPRPGAAGQEFTFTEASINVSTALIVTTFFKAVEAGIIPDRPEYLNRLFSELYLQQEVPNEQLCDFFLVLQYVIDKWRKRGVSVGPGRGSSGGMLTAMICGITYGDPIKKGFLESRWMNRGRKAKGSHADIDIDVSDRQVAGYELAKVAKESFDESVRDRPLSALEQILHAELFFSSAPVTHEQVGDRLIEIRREKKDTKKAFAENVASIKAHKSLADLAEAGANRKSTDDTASGATDDFDGDAADKIEISDEGGMIVWGSPIIRVGTYGSLKAKAAVKEAIRILDDTPFEHLPPFADPPPAFLQENRDRLHGLSDDQINAFYEEKTFGHLSQKERTARRRVRLGDRITKDMAANSGLFRLYQSERDYFMGSVYGDVPAYWDASARPPSGSQMARAYFDGHPEVKDLVLDLLNVYKSAGVHAGGFCFGREVLERVPVRADKHGYVSQFEMKDLEVVGVLKFDVLGVATLTWVSESLKLMVAELPYESLGWWLPRAVYDRVVAGESTDIMWRHAPKSTKAAVEVMCVGREATFQIDTKVFGKELDKLRPEDVLALVRAVGDDMDINNDRLPDILNALLALFRPGPMKLNSHIEYIERMQGKPYTVIHPWLEPFVRDTLGVIAYQEQVMASTAAGMGVPVADPVVDEIRRAMGKKDIESLKKIKAEERFKEGVISQGVPAQIADEIWNMIVPFAEYGFNSPHSYHYGLITAMTLFLKGHYEEFFMSVSMAHADSADAARFLGSIAKKSRTVCVLRSREGRWRVVNGEYYPNLSSIEGLKTKDVDRILKVQDRLAAEHKDQPVSAELFFSLFGEMTESQALTLARSGALRIFGTPDEIADGYAQALLKHIKPRKRLQKAAAEAVQEPLLAAAGDGMMSAAASDEGDLSDLRFGLREGFEGSDEGEEEDEEVESPAPVSKSTKARTPKPKKERAYTLGKKDMAVVEVLRNKGLTMISAEDQAALGEAISSPSNVMTVESAVELVKSNKTKGAGIRHLIAALVASEALAQVSGAAPSRAAPFYTLRELKTMRDEGGLELESGYAYRTVAIPKGISSSENRRTGQSEPRVTFIAEGIELSAKFSDRSFSPEQREQIVAMLKDGKMKTPFIIRLWVGRFSNETGQEITYYKIDEVSKIGAE